MNIYPTDFLQIMCMSYPMPHFLQKQYIVLLRSLLCSNKGGIFLHFNFIIVLIWIWKYYLITVRFCDHFNLNKYQLWMNRNYLCQKLRKSTYSLLYVALYRRNFLYFMKLCNFRMYGIWDIKVEILVWCDFNWCLS